MADSNRDLGARWKGKYGTKIGWAFFLPALAGNTISLLMQRRGWPSPPWEQIYMLLVGGFVVGFHAAPAGQALSLKVGALWNANTKLAIAALGALVGLSFLTRFLPNKPEE
jgi:hypothetical protein